MIAPAGAQRQAQLSWWDRAPVARSSFYIVKSDLPAAEAAAYAAHLDRMYVQFAQRLAGLPPRTPEKLNVFIFSSYDEYLLTMRDRWYIDAADTGGMFFVRPGGSGLAFFTGDRPRRRNVQVAQHEGFHQFAYSRFGGDLPPWLNEGLAELFGQAVLIGDDLLLGHASPRVLDSIQRAIARGDHVPLHDMLSLADDDWIRRIREGDAALLYHQAWSIVHFLVYGDGRRYQGLLERFLRLINNGVRAEHAFTQIFGSDLQAFEQRWRAHVKSMTPSPFAAAMERIEFLAEGSLALRGRAMYPETLDEMRHALREIDFVHRTEMHGLVVELSAAEDDNFSIPAPAGADEDEDLPEFVVARPDLNRMERRERIIEEEIPSPSIIHTEHVRPRNLVVRWIRSEGEFRYEVVF